MHILVLWSNDHVKPLLIQMKSCPMCTKDIPQYKGEGLWCNHCDWNLVPEKDQEQSVFDKYHVKIGKNISQTLFESMLRSEHVRPTLSFRKLSTLMICISVVALPLIMLGLSYLAYMSLPKMIFGIVALVSIGIVYVSLMFKRTLPENRINRSEAPELHNLIDRISSKLEDTKITQISLTHDFNAFYNEFGVGPFKKRYVSLGVPLVSILEADELVALIAHEISHGVNGDVTRNTLMYRARVILAEIYRMLAPRYADEGTFKGDSLRFWFNLSNYFGYALSMIPLSTYKLITWLSMRDSQEAEYYADILASGVSGKNAMIRMLQKIRHQDNFDVAVGKATTSQGKINFFEEMQSLCSVEKSEHAQLRQDRIEERWGLSLDSTHPPTHYRIKYIFSKATEPASVALQSSEFNKIKAEFAVYHEKTAKKLIDDHLYYTA